MLFLSIQKVDMTGTYKKLLAHSFWTHKKKLALLSNMQNELSDELVSSGKLPTTENKCIGGDVKTLVCLNG
jgi:hypothetical protein